MSIPGISTSRVQGRGFLRDLTIYAFANLLFLGVSAVTTFLLPKLLSVSDYGWYRLFVLYAGFTGILHCGLLDGALVRWTGRDAEMQSDLLSVGTFFLVQQVLVVGILLGAGLHLLAGSEWIWFALSLGLYGLVWNLYAFGQFTLQARKDFQFLSVVTVTAPLLSLIFVTALYRVGKLGLQPAVWALIGANLISGVLSWSVVLLRGRYAKPEVRKAWAAGVSAIGLGWPILISNLLLALVGTVDRFVLSASFSIRDFAIYSLAANSLAIVLTMITSASRVVFPHLADHSKSAFDNMMYSLGERAVVCFWSLGLLGFFPMRWAILKWLPQYASAIPLIAVLLVGTVFTALIHILHLNFFRVLGLQKVLMAAAAAGLSVVAVLVGGATQTSSLFLVAVASVVGMAGWWFISESFLCHFTSRKLTEAFRSIVDILIIASVFLGLVLVEQYATVLFALFLLALHSFNLRSYIRARRFPWHLHLHTAEVRGGDVEEHA